MAREWWQVCGPTYLENNPRIFYGRVKVETSERCSWKQWERETETELLVRGDSKLLRALDSQKPARNVAAGLRALRAFEIHCSGKNNQHKAPPPTTDTRLILSYCVNEQ